MKKIALVARGLNKNGVRSFIETKLEMSNLGKGVQYLLFTDEKEYQKQFFNLEVIYIPTFNKIIWDYFVLPIYLHKHKVSQVIYPKNIIPFTHFPFKWEKIIYVLDLAFKYPELKAYGVLDTLYMSCFLSSSLKQSAQVWAISNFTKKEILNFYPFVKANKIIVKHLPISSVFKKKKDKKEINSLIKKYYLKKPFIFYCGSISPRKNILSLLQAFNKIKDKVPHNLYLVSSRNWNSNDVFNYLNKNLKERVKVIDGVSDEELAILYSIADLFVYPSLYEGFGLPIKEAEACGCKVLTSNFGAMKEVAGKDTTLVNTKDVEQFADIMLKELKK